MRGVTLLFVRRVGLDLTVRQLAVMLICYTTTQRLTISDLADKLQINKTSITRIADRLAHHGLVVCERSIHDRRNVCVVATEFGRQLIQEMIVTSRSGGEMLSVTTSESGVNYLSS
jgi:DNA-binding MarR family transcriptional regulator